MTCWGMFLDEIKTHEMCIRVVEEVHDMLEYVSDLLKSQEMCEKTIEK